jgi:hypothetical protein
MVLKMSKNQILMALAICIVRPSDRLSFSN